MNHANAFELYGKYKNLYLFNTGKGSILFKPLSYEKSQTAKKICDAYPALAPQVEDDIWEECVIECTLPEHIDNMNAGLVSTIVRLILSFSNPSNLEQIDSELKELRATTASVREEIVIKICQAFPAYKPEEVEAMEWRTQLKRLTQAEKILNTVFEFKSDKQKPSKKDSKNAAFGSDKEGPMVIDWEKENQILAKS